MWKEVNLLSTNFSAKHTPSATLMIEIQSSDMRFALLVKIVSQSQRDDKTLMVSMLKCVLPDPLTRLLPLAQQSLASVWFCCP